MLEKTQVGGTRWLEATNRDKKILIWCWKTPGGVRWCSVVCAGVSKHQVTPGGVRKTPAGVSRAERAGDLEKF